MKFTGRTGRPDDAGRPLELDLWKVDFSPLLRWPRREDLTRMFSERPSH